jgi:methyl-accepting chemotaxis protein
MKFRRAAPATMIAAVIVVVVVSAVISNRMFSGMTATVEASQFEQMEKVLQFNLKGAANRALARAELIADLPATKRLMAAKDRDGLLGEYQEMFASQHDKHAVASAQFILPPAMSFLRLNNPAAPPEDLAPFRPLIVAVDKDRLAQSGVSVGRSGPAIFAVVPIKDAAGAHLGIFEAGIDIGGVLDNLKNAYDYELGFFVQEQLLRDVATGAPPEVFDEKNRVGRYLKFHSTNSALIEQLVGSGDVDGVEEPVRLIREASGTTYGVLLVPVRSPSGGPLGLMAVATDFSGTRGAAGRSLVWQGLIAAFGIILLSGVILIVVRGFLLSPLRAIVQGKPLDDDPLCDELQELARVHAELRARTAAPEVADTEEAP